MKPENFLDNFEVLAEAPNGVKKLREMILELAVRGKLVAQDKKDEPASKFLQKIEVEKEKLIKDKKIKPTNMLFPPPPLEVLYELPIGWKWTRLGTICTKLVDGSHNPPPDIGSGIPMLSSQNVLNNYINFYVSRYVSEDDYKKEFARTPIEVGDVFLTIVGTIGRSAVVPPSIPRCAIQRSIALLRSGIFPYYLSIYLRSPIAHEYFDKYGKGTAQKGIYLNKISLLDVPIPPLVEQRHIVAKVDQLMSICDELEARQQKKRESRARINSAALDRMLTARAPGEFADGWRRISDNFEVLYDTPENVGALRQAILQLAVMGKLVEQDERDESASSLLEKIKAEKERLIKEKKIKKDEPLPSLIESNIPHQLPSSWKWISLGELIDYNSGQKVSPGEIPEDAWLLDLEDIEKDTSKIIQRLTAKERESKSTKASFGKGDVLYGKLRPYLNKVVVADSDGFCTTEIVPLRIYYGISPKYLMYALKRPDFLSYVNSKTYGVKMPRLGTNDARSAPFPLPPLAEQHRIVARVDQLMSLCDKLEVGLLRSQADSEKLMEAVVGRMLAGGGSEK